MENELLFGENSPKRLINNWTSENSQYFLLNVKLRR